MTYTPPPIQQAPAPAPKHKNSKFLTVVIVIGVVLILGWIAGKVMPTSTTPAAAPAPVATATASDDSDFLFVVSDDLDTPGMVAMGKKDADIVSIAKEVCKTLKGGASEKAAAKVLGDAPWLVSGAAGHFVSSAHTFYCPEV